MNGLIKQIILNKDNSSFSFPIPFSNTNYTIGGLMDLNGNANFRFSWTKNVQELKQKEATRIYNYISDFTLEGY